MIFFSIIFLLILLLESSNNKRKKITYILTLMILIVFSGIRYKVGTDYDLYNIIFNSFKTIESASTSRTGLLFSILIYITKIKLSLNYEWLIFICSFITIYLIIKYISEISEMPGLTILLFISLGFYVTSMNIFRQFLSISFYLYGNYYLFEKKDKIKVLLFYLVSFFIHNISIIGIIGALIVFFTKKKKFPYKTIFILSIIILSLLNPICNFIFSRVTSLSIYLGKEYIPGLGTYLMVSVYLIVYMILILNKNKIIKMNSQNEIYFRLSAIGIALMIFELNNHLFYRLALYFIFYFILLITSLIQNYKNKDRKDLVMVCYTAMFIYYVVYAYSFGNVIPYNTVFQLGGFL